MAAGFPFFGGNGGTRGAILRALSGEWPLSAKEVFNRVKKESKELVSYQAVHKCLGDLVSSKILEKNEKGYLLSLAWIDSNESQFSALHAAYTNDFIKSIEGKTLEFDTLYAVDKFLIQALNSFLPLLPKKPALCLHWNHMWLPLFMSREDYASVKGLAAVTTSFALIRGNNPIDKWCRDFWVERGMKVELGADAASTFDLVVLNDFVLQVFYPLEIKQRLNEIYSKTQKVSDLDLDDFFKSVFEQKTRILVKATRDPTLAEELRRQTMSFFK